MEVKHPDELRKEIEALESKLRVFNALADSTQEHVCFICESFGYGYNDKPADWFYIGGNPKELACAKCHGRWVERFGDAHELTKEIEI